MGLFDLFKKTKAGDHDRPDENALFENTFNAILKEATSKGDHYSTPPIQNLSSFKGLKEKDEPFLKNFLWFTLDKSKELKEKSRTSLNKLLPGRSGFLPASIKLAGQLLKMVSTISDVEFHTIVKKFKEGYDEHYFYLSELPYNILLDKASSIISRDGVSENIKQALQLLVYEENPNMYIELKKINERINFLLQGNPGGGFNKNDRFGKILDEFISTQDNGQQSTWIQLFNSCISAAAKAAPSQKWLVEIKKILLLIGEDRFSSVLSDWLQFNKELLRNIHKEGSYSYDFLRDENHQLLKGLAWCAGLVNNPLLNASLDEYAGWAFKKLPGVGPVSAKTGTACMHAFSMLPFKDGMSRLVKFKMKVKNNAILKSIDKIIDEVAEKNGFSQEQVMEMGVPDFGLNKEAELVTPFGEYNAVFQIKGMNLSELVWEKNGKIQKAIPQTVKNEKANELKAFRNIIKEIEELLPIQKERIERLYLTRATWKYPDWIQHYILHPLVSVIAKKLIWHFSNGTEKKEQGFYESSHFVNAKSETIDWINDETIVQLWHPIGFSADAILQWRNFLQHKEMQQPFKQAYREIYILTDAEINTGTYSNRFAAHILRQHQFAALCKQRGWSYHLMGQWDSHNTPSVSVPKWNIRAEFSIEADGKGTANEAGIYTYIGTDQVRFYKGGVHLQLMDVPAMVFTEVMRDVDLFVGVTSIGNDAAWQDGGDSRMDTYRHDYSFGDLTESSKIRSEVLRNLVPRLKIAGKCSFDGRYLLVRGKLRSYKIHMGSGNILMEPNDQYLCIVPGRSAQKNDEKIFLPFEGDNMLSIIISKAFLLADDDKITDTTITRQIRS